MRADVVGLLAEDFDLTLLGISDDDLDALLRDPEARGDDGPVEDEDDVPELPVTLVSVPGDPILRHRPCSRGRAPLDPRLQC